MPPDPAASSAGHVLGRDGRRTYEVPGLCMRRAYASLTTPEKDTVEARR